MSDTVQQGLSEEFMLPVRAGLKPPEMREASQEGSRCVARERYRPVPGGNPAGAWRHPRIRAPKGPLTLKG